MKLKVYSEIGKLEKVLVHRPGKELENLTPDILERLLFDDIPFLKEAQKEHDEFTGLMRSKGVKVYYLTNLMQETIEDNPEAYEEFIGTFINEAISANHYIIDNKNASIALEEYLRSITDVSELIALTIAGIRADDMPNGKDFVKDDYYLIADPMPNLYFQRDPFAVIGDSISLNHMHTSTRNRETLYADMIFKYHPEFKEEKVKRLYDRDYNVEIEGGDILVLNEETLLIGISQRTRFDAIEKISYNLLYEDDSKFKQIVALNIGQSRKFMHLDTVFTQVDYNKFSVHPEIIKATIEAYVITKGEEDLNIQQSESSLTELLAELTHEEEIILIPCGGNDRIAAAREQWNDGANTLAIAPGEVIVYSRNPYTNKQLEEHGVKINVISSAELSRGRGGPRCMSMPLQRKSIKERK